MLRRLLGLRVSKPVKFTHDELDYMWEDDTIDIKNYLNMEPGQAKDEMRAVLSERRKWYNKQGLNDWAEQIDIALDERV